MTSQASSNQLAELSSALQDSGCEILPDDYFSSVETRGWNGAHVAHPGLIVRCASPKTLQLAWDMTRAQELPVCIHSTGRDWRGRSLKDNSVVLDLSAMNAIKIDVDALEVSIEGGVTTSQLNNFLRDYDLVTVIGNEGSVGMAGFLMGGGYGPLMTRYGLGCDNLIAADILLPNGEKVFCDDNHEPQLFWAIRGGGGNFGVLVNARLRLYAPPALYSGSVVFPWKDAAAALECYEQAMHCASEALFGSVAMVVGPAGKPILVVSLIWTAGLEQGIRAFEDLAAVGDPINAKAGLINPTDVLALTDGKLPAGRGYEVGTGWFDRLSTSTISTLIAAFDARSSDLSSIIIHHCHGVATAVAPNATAFGMRKPHFTALIYGSWLPDSGDGKEHIAWVHTLKAALSTTALPGGYANLLPDGAEEQISHAYGENGSQLAQLKRRFDPNGVLAAIPLPK